jgi:type IV secretory pathway TrbD component
MAEATRHEPVEAAGEAIHLPDPSYLPVLVALGTTIVLVGVVINWVVFAFGVAITLVATLRWVGQARAENAELPLEHHS